jgi:uncharacterized RDD family membrane protein YckC
MQGPDEVRIETPEQIDLALEPAGLGSRFYAWFIDVLIWAGVLLLVGLLGAVLLGLLGVAPSAEWLQGMMLALIGAFGYATILGYDIFFELRWNGQTPGKRVAGLRVMREGGAPVDFRSSCVRNLLRPVDYLPGFYLFGGLLVLLTARRQRLGDLAAGTLVIRERALAAPAELDAVIGRFASDDFAFTPDHISACSANDRYLLRSYFLRFDEMDEKARYQLAGRLARTFREKTGYDLDWPLNGDREAVAFLASLYRDLDKWARHGRK